MMIEKDLEKLTKSIVISNGSGLSVTRLVYELLKDLEFEDKMKLFENHELFIDKSIIERINEGRKILNDNNSKADLHSLNENSGRPSLSEWLANKRQL